MNSFDCLKHLSNFDIGVILFCIIIIILIITRTVPESFYYSPFNDGNCKLTPFFHGNGYDYGKHRSKNPNMRGMKIGNGYRHDLQNNANYKPFPVIWYTMKGCHFCDEFEKSGVWDKLKAEYGDSLIFKKIYREDAPNYISSFPTFIAEIDTQKLTYNGERNHKDMRQWLNELMIRK